jgi:hypothetical protein
VAATYGREVEADAARHRADEENKRVALRVLEAVYDVHALCLVDLAGEDLGFEARHWGEFKVGEPINSLSTSIKSLMYLSRRTELENSRTRGQIQHLRSMNSPLLPSSGFARHSCSIFFMTWSSVR